MVQNRSGDAGLVRAPCGDVGTLGGVTREVFAQWLGWIAALAFFARLVPQPVKLFRTGVPHGVSPLAVLNNIVTDVGWIMYGTVSGTTQVWLTALVALVPGLWTAALLRREVRVHHALTASVWLVIVMVTLPLGLLGSVLGVSVVVNHGPQVWTVIRQHNLLGVSVLTWSIAIADATLWGGFGVLREDPALIGYGVVLLSVAIIVLGRVWWTSRHDGLTPGDEPDTDDEALAYTPGP